MTTGSKNTIVGGFSGNQNSVDIRTLSNYIVLSDGDGYPAFWGQGGSAGYMRLEAGRLEFPATQNASSNANTLDDYEEGTWTPTFVFTGGAGSLTYTTQSGSYTKIGKMVTVQCLAVVSNKGTASGEISMVMPFTAASGTFYSAAALTWNFITYSANSYTITAQGGQGSASLTFYNEPSGGTKTGLDVSQCGSTFEIIFTITYQANA
jgi:hypothetical protein